jgi:hypothetical protein
MRLTWNTPARAGSLIRFGAPLALVICIPLSNFATSPASGAEPTPPASKAVTPTKTPVSTLATGTPQATKTPTGLASSTATALPSPTATFIPRLPTRTPTAVPQRGFDLHDVYTLLQPAEGTPGSPHSEPTSTPSTLVVATPSPLPTVTSSPRETSVASGAVRAEPALDLSPSRAPAPTATSTPAQAPRPPVARQSSSRAPLVLTPGGQAGGGVSRNPDNEASKVLSVVGLLALATGGSWGFFYFLKPKAK